MKKISLLFALFISVSLMAQTSSITVTDEQSLPIPNAHIKIIETGKLSLTNEKGETTLNFLGQSELNVEVSYIGFVKLTQTVYPNTNVTFRLKEDVVSLNSFVVTGQYAENNPEKAVQKITIIDQEKINKMAAVNLTDVLENETNIRLSQDGVLGSSMSVQGMSGENVKILIDGVPVIGRLDGSIDISQINLNDVERIEIVEGPMSVNYGTNALAGVVNIITKKGGKDKTGIKFNTYYENIGTYNIDGTAHYKFGKNSTSVSLGRNYFDGWKDGDPLFMEREPIADSTRFKTWKPKEQYFARFNYQFQAKKVTIGYTLSGFNEKITNRGMPRKPYNETSFDDYYRTLRLDNAISANYSFNNKKQLNVLAAYNYFQRKKNTYYKDLTTLEEQITTNPADQDTSTFDLINVRTTFSNANDSSKVNYEIGSDIYYETAQGVRIDGNNKFIGDYAAFASLEYRPFENTTIRPGLRYSYNTEYKAPLTPSLNVLQRFGKFNLRASYARGFRAPSLKELYFNFVDINHNIVGSQLLEAEHSNNFNLATNYTKLINTYLLKFELSGFFNQINNLITLAQNSGTQFTYVNIGNFSTNGVQLGADISLNHFKFGIAASYIGRENILAQTTNVEKFNYSPELRLNSNYEIKKWNSFIAVFYKYNGRLSSFAMGANDEVIQTYINSYQMADLSIGKRFFNQKMVVTLGSKNLFDVKNVNAMGAGGAHSGGSTSNLVAMGRTYFAKLTFNLSFYEKK